jgi:hypothetical protein
MTTKSKQRGTETETMVVKHLRPWWPEAERRILAGVNDKGDVINVPLFCLEIKGDRSNRLSAWKEETLREMGNAGTPYCALIVRVERKPVGQWQFWMPLEQLGIPVYGEDAWACMSLDAGMQVMEILQSRAMALVRSSPPTASK